MYNTAYSNLSSQPKSLQYHLDLDTIGKIADIKSTLFEQSYNEIANLKASTLNLSTHNPYANERIKQYNNEIQNFFKSNDLKNVDLNNNNIISQYKDVFNKIDSDTELRDYYRHEKEQEKVLRTYADASKNPSKSGYNQSNHIVWLHESWKPMVESSDLIKAQTYSGNYLPGYDVRKDLESVKANLKFNGSTVDIIEPNGRKTTVMKEELSSSRIQGYLRNIGLSQQALNQLENDSKASTYMLWDSYPKEHRNILINKRKQEEDILLSEQIDQNKRQKEYNIAKINILKNKKDKNYETQIQQLQQDNDSYDVNINLLKNNLNSDFPTDKLGFAKRVANLDVSRKIKNIGDHMAYSIEKTSKNIDSQFFALENLKLNRLKTESQLEKDKSIIAKNYSSIDEGNGDNKSSNISTSSLPKGGGVIQYLGAVPGSSPSVVKLSDLENEKQEAEKAIKLVTTIVNKPSYDKESEEFIRSSLNKTTKEMTPLDIQVSKLANVYNNNYPAILAGIQDMYKRGEFNSYIDNKSNRLAFITNTINKAWTKYKDVELGMYSPQDKEQVIRKMGKTPQVVDKLNSYINEEIDNKYNPAYIINTDGKNKATETYLQGLIGSSLDFKLGNTDIIDGPYKYDPSNNKLTFNVYTKEGGEKTFSREVSIDVPTNAIPEFPQKNNIDILYEANGGTIVQSWVDGNSEISYNVKVNKVKGSNEKTFIIQAKDLKTGKVKTINSIEKGLYLTGTPSDILRSIQSNITDFFK